MATVSFPAPVGQVLSAIEYHGLKLAAKPAEKLRDTLQPGRYEVDVVVHVHGSISVGEDSQVASSATPDAEGILALVLSKLNLATRAACLREVLADIAADGRVTVADPDRQVARELLSRARESKITTRRGSVTGSLSCDLVPSFAIGGAA